MTATPNIIQAYLGITGGRLNETVALSTLRRELPVFTRGEIDAGLIDLFRQGRAVLFPEDNTRMLTPDRENGAIIMGGEPKHFVKIDR